MRYEIVMGLYIVLFPALIFSQAPLKNIAQKSAIRNVDQKYSGASSCVIPFDTTWAGGELVFLGTANPGDVEYPETLKLSSELFEQYVMVRKSNAVRYMYRLLCRFSDYNGSFDQAFFDTEVSKYASKEFNPEFKAVSRQLINDRQTVICYGAFDDLWDNNNTPISEPYGFFVHLLLQKNVDGSVQQFFIMPPSVVHSSYARYDLRNWLGMKINPVQEQVMLVSDEEYKKYSAFTGDLSTIITSSNRADRIRFSFLQT